MTRVAVIAVVLACALQADPSGAAANLLSADPVVRTRAACDLREMGRDAVGAMPRLAAMLGDGTPVDRAVCNEHTWRMNGGEEPTSPGEQAASALVAIGSPAYETLTQAMASAAWIARRNAAWALGALGNRGAVSILAHALTDSEAAVRGRSAWALGALDGADAVPALVEALKDPDAGVRQQAAWALGAIGDHRGVDGLIGALSDQASSVRRQAAWALGALGDRRAVAALTKTLKDTDAGVRRQSAWALGAIGG